MQHALALGIAITEVHEEKVKIKTEKIFTPMG
jgi:hypothetical protein